MVPTTLEAPQGRRSPAAPAFAAPVDPLLGPSAAELPLPGEWKKLIWAFLLLGLAARVIRYIVCFPLWEDECFLVYNLIDRDYLQLLEPLDYHQVCPLLFLWLEATAVRLLGFNEFALRLFPFLTSIGGLFLFRHVAGRLLRGWALVLAVGWFAVSYPMIRYAAEAKPYGTDLFLALAQIALVIEWRRKPSRAGWLWGLVAMAPLAVGLSFPAIFVAGGVSLFVLDGLWRERSSWRQWAPWAVYNLAIAGSFLAIYAFTTRHQHTAELEYMNNCWQAEFPPFDRPLALPLWLLNAHSSALVAFPFGGRNGASALTLVCCVAAVAYLLRRRAWPLLLLCLAPLALHFAAAALERYPYGGHVKLSMYLGATVCLLSGLGAAELLARLRIPPERRLRSARIAVGVLVLVAGVSIARDLWRPAKNLSDVRARDFARWFWLNAEHNAEVACLKSDLHLAFAPQTYRDLNWSAMYLVNQRIYSPRRAQGEPLRLDRVSVDRPLRCVEYRCPNVEADDLARQAWLDEMQSRYDLVGRETLPFVRYNKRDTAVVCVDYLETYDFVPKRTERAATARGVNGLPLR